MSVVLTRHVRLRVGAGAAKPGPAIGQALGPLGLNMAEFCKQFNEATKIYDKDTPIPVVLSGMSYSVLFLFQSPYITLSNQQHFPIGHLPLLSRVLLQLGF